MAKNVRREAAGIYTSEGNVAGARAGKMAKLREQQEREYKSKQEEIRQKSSVKALNSINDKFQAYDSKAEDEFSVRAPESLAWRAVAVDPRSTAPPLLRSGAPWVLSAQINSRKRKSSPMSALRGPGAFQLPGRAAGGLAMIPRRRRQEEQEDAAATANKRKKKKKKGASKKRAKVSTLSFEDEEAEAEEGGEGAVAPAPAGEPRGEGGEWAGALRPGPAGSPTPRRAWAVNQPKKRRKRLGMNPEVETSFLPDSERDAELAKKREELKQQWREEQERIRGASPPRASDRGEGRRVLTLRRLPAAARPPQRSRWRSHTATGTDPATAALWLCRRGSASASFWRRCGKTWSKSSRSCEVSPPRTFST